MGLKNTLPTNCCVHIMRPQYNATVRLRSKYEQNLYFLFMTCIVKMSHEIDFHNYVKE